MKACKSSMIFYNLMTYSTGDLCYVDMLMTKLSYLKVANNLFITYVVMQNFCKFIL